MTSLSRSAQNNPQVCVTGSANLELSAMSRLFVLLIAAMITGCAADRPFEPPVHIPLQDPPTGQGIVYLLRAPHDNAAVVVAIDEKVVARLSPGSYTALVLSPGTHTMTTRANSGQAEIAPSISVTVAPETRRFLNLSGITSESVSIQGVMPIAGALVPLITPSITTRGDRSWKDVTELDAQGLMSISQVALPERGEL